MSYAPPSSLLLRSWATIASSFMDQAVNQWESGPARSSYGTALCGADYAIRLAYGTTPADYDRSTTWSLAAQMYRCARDSGQSKKEFMASIRDAIKTVEKTSKKGGSASCTAEDNGG